MTLSWTTLSLLVTVMPCVALGATTAAAAQEAGDPPAPTERTARSPGATGSVFDRLELSAVRADLLRLRAELDAQGLPGEMVEEKAAEGLSKHIPAQPILAACRQVAARLISGREALISLRLPLEHDLLRAMVDAQAVGASPAALLTLGREVRAPVRRERARTTLAALQAVAELGEREFDIDDALRAVGNALRNGGGPAVRELLVDARSLRGTRETRGNALRERSLHGRPESPGRSGSSQGQGPPHDVGYGQGRGRGNAMNPGMNPG